MKPKIKRIELAIVILLTLTGLIYVEAGRSGEGACIPCVAQPGGADCGIAPTPGAP